MAVFAYTFHDPLLDKEPNDVSGDLLADEEQPVTHRYQDWGDRVQLQQMLTDCQTTEAPIRLYIRRLEELGDSVSEVCDRLHDLETLQVELVILEDHTAKDPKEISEPPPRSEMLDEFQALHARQRQRKIQRGHARNRVNAKPPPGKAPYGYRRGKDRYIVDRSTAPVVKDFFDHFLLYGSLRRSVRYLMQKYNKKISVSTGKRWLSNPVYRGHLAYKTGEMITHTHTAILAEEEAAQVDRLLRRNRQLPRRSASAERSLAGLVRCAHCQSAMTITRVTQRGKKRDYVYLRPTTCLRKPSSPQPTPSNTPSSSNAPPSSPEAIAPVHQDAGLPPLPPSVSDTSKPCPAIPYDQVLDRTIDNICHTLPQVVAQSTLPDIDALRLQIQQQVDQKQTIIEQLADLEQNGILDAETAMLRSYKLRNEIATLQASSAQLPPVNLQATVQEVSLRQFWLDLSETERRFYFREFIHQIEIIRSDEAPSGWATRLVLLLGRGHQPPQNQG